MTVRTIKQIIEQIHTLETIRREDLPLPISERCIALPWLTWDPKLVEEELRIRLPSDLIELWDTTSGLVLFQDMTYGQSGLVIWSPEQTILRHRHFFRLRRSEDFRTGDLIIGEFLGDTDLVIVRSDPHKPDLGAIVIAVPIDRRKHWPTVAPSLRYFLQRFLAAQGAKFWEG